MIIENNVVKKVEGDAFDTIKSKVNKSKLAKLYSLLSNIYKNPIGSIVREYASNGYDANVEAYTFGNSDYDTVKQKYPWVLEPEYGISEQEFVNLKSNLKRIKETEPVIVGLRMKNNRYQFFVKDFGIGLSPKRMMNIFFDYLSSTKEDTNDEIGGFGIGAKSGLSIYNEFYIDTVYNGIQYQYMMGKDEMGIPEGTLLYQGEYDDSLDNGTMISMYIELEQIEDYIREFKSQLAYLNNVYFELDDSDFRFRNAGNINDFKVYKYKEGWSRRTNTPFEYLHISLGNIAYPLDFSEIGLSYIVEPFALDFKIGELQPTPSREAIVYNDKSRKLILERIRKLQKYYVDKAKDFHKDTNDFGEFMKSCENSSSIFKDTHFMVDLEKLSESSFKAIHAEYIPFKQKGIMVSASWNINIRGFLKQISAISQTSARANKFSYERSIGAIYGPFLLQNPEHDDNVNAQLGSNFKRNAYLFDEGIFNHRDAPILLIPDYLGGINLPTGITPQKKAELGLFVKKEIYKYFSKHKYFIDYYKYEPHPNWHLGYFAGYSRFSPKKKLALQGSINALQCNALRESPWFNRTKLNLNNLSRFKGILIYCRQEDKLRLETVISILNSIYSSKKVNRKRYYSLFKGLVVSKDNYKILEEMENAVNIDDVVLKIKPFSRLLTCIKISNKWRETKPFLSNIYDVHELVSKKYLLVDEYYKECESLANSIPMRYQNFMNDAMVIAEENNLIDEHIVSCVDFLADYAEGLDLIRSIHFPLPDVAKEDLYKFIIYTKKKKARTKYFEIANGVSGN